MTIKVTASKEGYRSAEAETSFNYEPSLILRIDRTVAFKISRGEPFYVGGVVLDDRDHPVEGAEIILRWNTPSGGTGGAKATSSAGGVWEYSLTITNDMEAGLYIVHVIANKDGYHHSIELEHKFCVNGESKTLSGFAPNAGVEVRCPVNVLITDSNGRCDGCFSNGTLVHDIPKTYFFMNETDDGRYWLFGLPSDTYNITITGTADGSFNLRLSSAEGVIQDYDMQPITKDTKATMILNPDNSTPLLTLSNGETVQPKNGHRGGGFGTMGIIAMVALLIVVATVWKRRKTTPPISRGKASRGDHCTKCGSTFQTEDGYCPNCGAVLDDQ